MVGYWVMGVYLGGLVGVLEVLLDWVGYIVKLLVNGYEIVWCEGGNVGLEWVGYQMCVNG